MRKPSGEFETPVEVRGRKLIVKLGTSGLQIRQKGCRSSYFIPYDALWDLGAKLEMLKERNEQ